MILSLVEGYLRLVRLSYCISMNTCGTWRKPIVTKPPLPPIMHLSNTILGNDESSKPDLPI